MRLQIIAVTLVLSSFLVNCRGTEDEQQGQPQTAPKAVKTSFVSLTATPLNSSHAGTVIPRNRAIIQSKIQAWVKSIPVSLGTRVSKGDLLVELDSRDLAARVAQAQSAESKSATDLKRFEDLYSRKLISQQEYEAAQVQQDIAKATLHEAQAMLSYARIEAPFNGTVTQRFVNVGDLTQSGISLITLEESGPLQFSVMLPESRLGHFHRQDVVHIYVPSIDSTISGSVLMIAESVDPVTRSFEMRVNLPASGNIMAGMFGRFLETSVQGDASLWIPATALIKRGQLDLVFVVNAERRAILRLVRIGQQDQENIQILAGLSAGEQIIVGGQGTLSDGDPIEELK